MSQTQEPDAGGWVSVTDALITQGGTNPNTGGWSREQFAILGVAWPPMRGWRRALVARGTKIPQEAAKRFLELRRGNEPPSDQLELLRAPMAPKATQREWEKALAIEASEAHEAFWRRMNDRMTADENVRRASLGLAPLPEESP